MRKPIQILVIPYRKNTISNCIQYCLFLREDLNVWQGIAGVVEDDETVEQSSRREMFEESNIPYDSNLIKLSSFVSMPSINISRTRWEQGIYIIKEYSFGVCADDIEIKISDEHKMFKWFNYSEAMRLLKWDSNKNALWELNERLCKNEY